MMSCVLAHQLSTVSISLLTMQPRTQLLARACDNDVPAIAQLINQGAALVATSDFLVSPTVGSLSDRIGRRPCMLFGPAACLPLKVLVALRPTRRILLLERVVCDALRTLTGTTMVGCALVVVRVVAAGASVSVVVSLYTPVLVHTALYRQEEY